MADYEHPPCRCGKPIVRREGERSCDWKNRQCCSRDCGYALQGEKMRLNSEVAAVGYQHPPCAFCGGPVLRHDGEFLSHYKRRPTCGVKCGIKLAARSCAKTAAENGRRYTERTAVMKSTVDEKAAIEAWIAARGIENIRKPTGFSAPTQACLSDREAMRRIRKMKLPEPVKTDPHHLFT